MKLRIPGLQLLHLALHSLEGLQGARLLASGNVALSLELLELLPYSDTLFYPLLGLLKSAEKVRVPASEVRVLFQQKLRILSQKGGGGGGGGMKMGGGGG